MTGQEPDPAVAPEARAPVGLVARVRGGIGECFEILRTDRLTVFASVTAAILLTASRYHFSSGEYARVFKQIPDEGTFFAWVPRQLGLARLADAVEHVARTQADTLYWFFGSFFAFFVVPLVAAKAARMPLGELGLGAGDRRFGLRATMFLYLVMLPFVVGASFSPAFARTYPLASGAPANWASLLVFETGYAAYFVGWEFLYRGLLCVALYPRVGAAALFLQAIPFAVMHGGKPEPEAFGSIIAGIALAALAVRTRSFWYGALLHTAVAMTMDALALTQTGRWPKAW